ncbi:MULTISPECIES: glycerate kinase [unclassified Planococcus (in: firmicutes)]|uniref:glycerate kinase n=1 Tax=unclassified Planococcus (in: firmicutes) TaxID=2662419 RepID=UPI000C33FDEB|nr:MULTISPECIES: glycerate kinase [unclassified Planococcus (in: firmicutes)]AUD13283.1 glycerate kinase [Planococcus sp. MB-3u-03]PKG45945.1 glycerate kinase [Planococcus sp. Urea-trap-24]PKG89182.1 glycerate kinase [Planococcus sp. Urea-3u-39]PKH41645.1 glycerate kinase [Planococcus sp. MB-3u-09]
MKIIVAPDSFKGSISAEQAARAMAQGIIEAAPDSEVIELPSADGGEGTMVNLVATTNGRMVTNQVSGPLGKPVAASYGVLGNAETCVIEIAEASGLTLLSQTERNPERASTEGTGELIRHALDAGFRDFIIGLGGSATNDGGTGLLRALGMRFLDAAGEALLPGAGALDKLYAIDAHSFDPRIQDCRFVIASDVDNPLVGPNGASHIFGPQKGATDKMAEALDRKLRHYADIVEKQTGVSLHDYAGAGAAGGAGGAFLAFFPAVMRRGIDVVLEASGFSESVASSDLIFTGEGKSDRQTLSGKTAFGIAQMAAVHGKPVILLSGAIDPESRKDLMRFFEEVHSVSGGAVTEKQSMDNASVHVRKRASEILNAYLDNHPQSD